MNDEGKLMADLAELLGIPIEFKLVYEGAEESDSYYGGFRVSIDRRNLEDIINAVSETKRYAKWLEKCHARFNDEIRDKEFIIDQQPTEVEQ
jgi:hypothetical protein